MLAKTEFRDPWKWFYLIVSLIDFHVIFPQGFTKTQRIHGFSYGQVHRLDNQTELKRKSKRFLQIFYD